MPSFVLNEKAPHSLLHSKDPSYVVSPRVFGCTCFVHDLSPGRDRMFVCAIKCVFLSYSCVQKEYWCYSPSTHCFYMFANVIFFEHIPYFPNSDVFTIDLDQVLHIPYFESV